MKPCYKRTPSDCFARCVESLVGDLVPPVPNFVVGSSTNAQQMRRAQRWLKKFGLSMVCVQLDNKRSRLFALPVPLYCILCLTNRKVGKKIKPEDEWAHAVVGRVVGKRITVAHDPDYFEGAYEGAMKLSKDVAIDSIAFIVHGDMIARGPVPRPPEVNPEE